MNRVGQFDPVTVDGPGRARGEGSDRLDFGALRSILRRRLRLFFYTAIIIFDLFALIALWLPPSYTATAVVILNGSDAPVTPTSGKTESDQIGDNSDVETEMAIITSRDMALKVVDYLRLDHEPDMRALLPSGGWFGLIGRTFGYAPPPPETLTDEQRAKLREIVIGRIARGLDVERVSTAYAFSVAYSDSNPIRAAAIANATAHLYTEEQIARKKAQNAETARLLGERIETLRNQTQRDFEALQRYRIDNGLLSTTGATLTEEEISTYNRETASARAQAAEDQARLGTALAQLRHGSNGDDVGEALSSPVVQSLRVKRAELSARVAEYGATFGPRNPDLKDALRQLADVDIQIQGEINRVVSNLDARAKVSAQRLSSLSGTLNSARGTLAQNNAAMVELDDLRRKADSSQALYESYLGRYKEAIAAAGAEQARSRLVSDARIPGGPSFPNKPLFLILGLLLGVGAGLVAALVAELSFTGLTSGEDVRQRLGLPYLGGVPLLKSVDARSTDPLIELREAPRGPFAQAVRGVLTTVRQSGQPSQIVMVTSALPDEGKTTLATCLAQVAAQSGERVLLIDCDAVRHQLSDRLGGNAANGPGLEEVLEGKVTIGAAIRQDEQTGLSLLPVTGKSDKPFLEGQAMQLLLGQLREHFALIIVDSAPILPVVETRHLAALMDRIVMIGQWRRTSEKALTAAFDLLPPAAQSITGVALTMINMKKQSRFTEGDAGAFYSSFRGYYHA